MLKRHGVIDISLMVCLVFSVTVFGGQKSEIPPDNITWYRAHFPPVTIPYGPDAGTGFFGRINGLLIQHLPEYTHTELIANFKRIIVELKQGENVCCPSLYKTPDREAFIAFSIPAVVVLPNVVIAKKEQKGLFQPYLNPEKN